MEAFWLLQYIIMEEHSNKINTLWWSKEKGSQIVRAKENPKLSHGLSSYR